MYLSSKKQVPFSISSQMFQFNHTLVCSVVLFSLTEWSGALQCLEPWFPTSEKSWTSWGLTCFTVRSAAFSRTSVLTWTRGSNQVLSVLQEAEVSSSCGALKPIVEQLTQFRSEVRAFALTRQDDPSCAKPGLHPDRIPLLRACDTLRDDLAPLGVLIKVFWVWQDQQFTTKHLNWFEYLCFQDRGASSTWEIKVGQTGPKVHHEDQETGSWSRLNGQGSKTWKEHNPSACQENRTKQRITITSKCSEKGSEVFKS